MERHQILRPRQLRGTPSSRVFLKLGLLSSLITVLGYYASDYLRGERHEKRMQAGRFLLEDHIRWHNMLMGRLMLMDSASARVIQRRQAEDAINEMLEESSINPNALDA